MLGDWRNDLRYAFNRPIEEARRRHVDAAARRLPPNSAVVDVGAGEMPYRSLFEAAWHTYTAVDPTGPAEGLDVLFRSVGFEVEVDVLAGTGTSAAVLAGFYVTLLANRHRRL